jgi:type IV secretion system protein VirB8
MNEQSRDALDAYYAEAASWNRDRVQAVRSSQRTAWWIAGVAAAIALLEAIALVLLTPLKTVEPYTLMVDKTTGYVQALKPLDQAKITPDAALTQSFLVQYVIAREGFDMATLNANYRKVALFSADTARQSYLQQMQVSNPASPLLLYPRTSVVDVHVKSVSPIGQNAALVRFDTVRSDAGAQPQPPSPWVAVRILKLLPRRHRWLRPRQRLARRELLLRPRTAITAAPFPSRSRSRSRDRRDEPRPACISRVARRRTGAGPDAASAWGRRFAPAAGRL